MESPVNASYGKTDVPENPGEKTKVLGMVFRKEEMWKVGLAIGGVFLVLVVIILILMPSGISFLAAKNASGLLGYMGLFTGYMFGFLAIVTAFFAAIVGVLYLVQVYA